MYDSTSYRKISDEEIGQLVLQGCSSDDWNLVEVCDRFNPENIVNARFSGYNKIGRFDEEVKLFGGITFKTGIFNAWLHNCVVEDNVLIYNVRGYIANYCIGNRSVIHNITTLAVDGRTSFGNGTCIDTISEGGGRKILIYDHLSTHVAYIMSIYRHCSGVVSKLESMIGNYVEYISNDTGNIGPGSKIIDCDTIKNVKTGPSTHIEGARKLENGSINSTHEDPVVIGDGVMMDNFIVCSGTRVADATLISKCFIGQGCILDKQFSAENSVFFSNCQGFHGEACSIFAGPYTVTHHKSTLLIAGMFSFMNAGSGSNQSNHLYKLGPIHQGIIERGSKTTSDSYLLWPAHIGAFSLVMGRHYKHSDTSNFPFSYLIESKDESILVPGINLKSVGTIRDTKKWPSRDRRKDPNKLDYINFNLLSPYTIQRVFNGLKILKDLLVTSGDFASDYSYQGMKIHKKALKRGIDLYEMAVWKFLGNSLITKLSGRNFENDEEIREALRKETTVGSGKWIDLSGLLCPAESLNKLLNSIEKGKVSSLEEVDSMIRSFHLNYYNYEWTWAYDALEQFYGKKISDFDANDIIEITTNWKRCVLELDRLLYEDAGKEFSLVVMTGFGIDGGEQDKAADFESVRGSLDSHNTIRTIKKHIADKEKLGDDLINKMQELVNKTTERNSRVCVE
jgi:NDP-sugar pyrophosphorylase family protein